MRLIRELTIIEMITPLCFCLLIRSLSNSAGVGAALQDPPPRASRGGGLF